MISFRTKFPTFQMIDFAKDKPKCQIARCLRFDSPDECFWVEVPLKHHISSRFRDDKGMKQYMSQIDSTMYFLNAKPGTCTGVLAKYEIEAHND